MVGSIFTVSSSVGKLVTVLDNQSKGTVMAAVFNPKNKTTSTRRIKDRKSDDTLPSAGLLKWGSIASDSALSGTTGTDCMLVSGDRWQEMQGKLTENYSGDKKI